MRETFAIAAAASVFLLSAVAGAEAKIYIYKDIRKPHGQERSMAQK